MGTSAGGGAAGLAAIGLLLIGLSLALVVYGSLIAFIGSRAKSAFGMLVGSCSFAVGVYVLWEGNRTRYDNKGKAISKNIAQQDVGSVLILVGMFLAALCFVLYVKQHNKTLQSDPEKRCR